MSLVQTRYQLTCVGSYKLRSVKPQFKYCCTHTSVLNHLISQKPWLRRYRHYCYSALSACRCSLFLEAEPCAREVSVCVVEVVGENMGSEAGIFNCTLARLGGWQKQACVCLQLDALRRSIDIHV